MNATRYRKKSAVVEAVQYLGTAYSRERLEEFCGHRICFGDTDPSPPPSLMTPNGALPIAIGDFVVKGSEADFYPVSPLTFYNSFDVIE